MGEQPSMDGLGALRALSRMRQDAVVVLSESTRQDWPPLSTRTELDFPMTGSMGKASSLALGIALARPEHPVWLLDSDGALLMNLGALITIATAAPPNLLHVVYDNEAYDTTGGQPTPGAGVVDFRAIALAAGYPRAYRVDRLEDLEQRLPEVLAGPFPTLLVLKVASRGRRPGAITTRTSRQAATEIQEYFSGR